MRTASVRALQRGLLVLEHFNRWDGSTITDVRHVIGAPYATTYRLLKTLTDLGLLAKGNRRGEYWLAARVKALSAGYRTEPWVADHAAKIVETLAERLQWPVFLLLRRDQTLVVRARSTLRSPLIRGEVPIGTAAKMEASAAGLAFLAFDSADAVKHSPGLRRQLANIRAAGFARLPETDKSVVQVAVPILVDGQPHGALMIRTRKQHMPQSKNTNWCASQMTSAAGEIAVYLPESVTEPGTGLAPSSSPLPPDRSTPMLVRASGR